MGRYDSRGFSICGEIAQANHARRSTGRRETSSRGSSWRSPGWGRKLGPILVQLPPSLDFDSPVAERFFDLFRRNVGGPVVCEPRHASWFQHSAESLLENFAIDRVAADPAILPAAADPGGCRRGAYFRWHGSPRTYYSAYNDKALGELANRLRATAERAQDVWCIFDNTAEGAALPNALALARLLTAG